MRASTRAAAGRPSVFAVIPQALDAAGRPLAESAAPVATRPALPPDAPVDRSAVTAESPPHGPKYRWRLLLVIGLAVLGFGSLMTLVTASLSDIADDMGTSTAAAGWVLTGLMLSMAVTTPMGGKLADRFGHRRIFLIGLGGMVTTMFANVWVPSIGWFIVVRVLFGVCGGMLMPSAMALLMHAFGPAERARAVGWFQFAMTGAPTIGVVIGGPLLDLTGWRGVFAIFGGVGLAALIMAASVVKAIPRGPRVPIDFLGIALLGGGTLLVLWAITRLPALVSSDAALMSDSALLAMLAGSAVCYALFVPWERRASAPLLDLRLFGRASFSLPLLSAACNQFAYMGAFAIVPAMLQLEHGYAYSVGVAALLMVPRPGAFAAASPLGGTAVTRLGPRVPMLVGTTAMIGSMAAFALGSDPGVWGLAAVVVGLVLSGVSAGIGSPAYQVLVANSVEDKDLGVANGMNQMFMWMGIIMGIQSMLAFAGDDADWTVGRLRATFLFGAAVAAIGFVAPLFATRRATRLA